MFAGSDNFVFLNNLSAKEIADCLTIQDVERFLRSLGINNLIICTDYIICPTYCHNKLNEQASLKLYWYQNHHVFHCYTECNESMSIYTFYQRFMSLNYSDITFEEALAYIRNFVTNLSIQTETYKSYQSPKDKFKARGQLVLNNKTYDKNVLDCFLPAAPIEWQMEGITQETMKKFDIKFYIPQSNIIIPCYDLNHNLAGIRCRETDENRIQLFSKYHPLTIGDTMYSFPSAQFLYGLCENKEAIQKYKRAIIVEGEKSVLKGNDFYHDDSVIVASLGLNNFGFYQLNLLIRQLGVTDVTIAFDKEYDDAKSEKGKKWEQWLKNYCDKYKNFVNISYIYDRNNLLEYKDSPLDKGKYIFEKLYKERVKV